METQDQTLCKALYDEFKGFGFYARQNYDRLVGEERELADLLKKIQSEFDPATEWSVRSGKKTKLLTDVFQNKEKEVFYQKLMVGDWGRNQRDNFCFLPTAGQFMLLFMEKKLIKNYGFDENGVRLFFIGLDKKRRALERQTVADMPSGLYHASNLSPQDLSCSEDDLPEILPKPATDDNFHMLARFVFCAEKGSFYPQLVLQGADSCFWPRFKPKTVVVNMSEEDFIKASVPAFLYHLDMTDKTAYKPCIPLWGGHAEEWVAVRPVRFFRVEKETVTDIVRKGVRIYFIPDQNDFQKWSYEGRVADKKVSDFTAKETQTYFDRLAREYPDKIKRFL